MIIDDRKKGKTAAAARASLSAHEPLGESTFRASRSGGQRCPRSQRQFHEFHARHRVVIVRPDLFETQRAIERDRVVHLRRQSVQTDSLATDLASLSNYGFRQSTTEPLAAKRRPDKQTLHLANPRADLSERDATGNLIALNCQKQTATRWCVITRELGKFLFKVLKTEIDLQPCGVFAE